MENTLKDHDQKDHEQEQEPEFNFEQMVIFAQNNSDNLEACDGSGSEGAGDS